MSDPIAILLARLRARVRGAELARTAGRLATIAAAGLLAWLTVDYWAITVLLGDGWWDLAARLGMTVSLAWIAWTSAGSALIAEYRRRRSDDELAMLAERANPGLGGRLISTVQLTRPGAAGGSPALVEALAERARAEADAIDHRGCWDAAAARSAVILAGAVLAAAIALAAWRPDIATAFARRICLLSAHYPTATRIAAVRIPALVGRGDPLVIEVEVDPASRVPAAAEASLRGSDGRTTSIRLERIEGGSRPVFRGSLQQAVADLAVRPRAGDHTWERWHDVRVLQRPAVSKLALRLVQPDYLHAAPQSSEVGDIVAPVGTRVEVTARLSRPVARAVLSLRAAPAVAAAPVALAVDGATATGAFTVTADGSWSIGLADAEGLDAGQVPEWTITALPDRAPTVTVTFPPRDTDVTRLARWPIRYTASDDHGLARLRLRWQVLPPGAEGDSVGGEPASLAVVLPAAGQAQIRGEVPFDLSPLDLATGSRVVWWLEAEDGRTPEANIAQSQRGTFTVLDPAEMRERLARERAELLDSIKGIKDRQRDAHDGVEGVRKAVGK